MSDILNLDVDVAVVVSEEVTTVMVKELGYSFDEERIKRIAAAGREIMAEGELPPVYALIGALDIDLLLYGDPLAPVIKLNGFHEILKEIYGDA